MASRRGYLDRLVADAADRRGRTARAPRQLAWGPTRPAQSGADELAPVPAPPVHATARPDALETPPAPPPVPAPAASPAPRPPLRAVTERRPESLHRRNPPAAAAPEPARPRVDEPVTERPPVPPAVVVERPAPVLTIERQVATPPLPPPAARPAVTAALERLAALSLPAPTAPPPEPRRPAAPAAPPAVRAGPVAPVAVEKRALAVLPSAPARERPAAPTVHIGSIEVTIAPPAAPPPPAAAPPPASVAPPAPPAARLSRPSAGYGLGQG